MKKCSTCNIEKPEDLGHFYKHSEGKNGLTASCKVCHLSYSAARYKANPERERKRAREWHRANPEKSAAIDRKKKYGLSESNFQEMLFSQKSMCAICAEEMKPASIDHCHATGQIRGLLCQRCNTGIGFLKDSPTILRKAAEYLEQFPKASAEGTTKTTQ